MPSIARAFELLNSLQSRGIHYNLDSMAWALALRGHPERKFQSVIVAGTNGKGSTSTFLHYMLRRLGFRTGLYTSPHLIEVRERIVVDDVIPSDALAELILSYEKAGIFERLTYYEALTLAAFDWFAAQEVEWAILEVGVGGRLDAVNLAPADGAVIVTVDFDHRELLGNSIAEIATEKAGVIKPSRPVVTGVLPPEAMAIIESVSREKSALLYRGDVAFSVKPSSAGLFYEGQGGLIVPEIGLPGAYQHHNLGVALCALERIVGIDPGSAAEPLREAIRDARWPGRFQQLSAEPLVLVDAAHNPAGAKVLVDSFRERYGVRKVTLVFAVLSDKDHNSILATLRPLADQIWLTHVPEQSRAVSERVLAFDPAMVGAKLTLMAPEQVLPRILAAGREDAFLVTGSAAFAGWFLGAWQASD